MRRTWEKVISVMAAAGTLLTAAACGSREIGSASSSSRPEASQSAAADSKPAEGTGQPDSLTAEEQAAYFTEYIQPYYITGLLYSTWSSVDELGVEQLIRFYTYNGLDAYYAKYSQEHPEEFENAEQIAVPAEEVEEMVSSFFRVDVSFLRQAENYDPATETYGFPKETGIGGGPGVNIVRVEKTNDDTVWTFVCSDMNGQTLSVTVELAGKDRFYYISGTGISLEP